MCVLATGQLRPHFAGQAAAHRAPGDEDLTSARLGIPERGAVDRRVTFLAVLLTIIGLGIWLLGSGFLGSTPDAGESDSNDRAASTEQAGIDESREQVPTRDPEDPSSPPITGDSERAKLPLVIRAANGFSLDTATVTDASGSSRVLRATSGRIAVAERADLVGVTAPGFRSRTIAPEDVEIALEPAAAFVLTMPGVREATRAVRIQRWMNLTDATLAAVETHGFVDANRWAIAFDRHAMQTELFAPRLEVEIELTSRHVLEIEDKFGVNDYVEVAVDWQAAKRGPARDLEIEIVASGQPRSAVKLDLWTTSAAVERREKHDWGSLALYAPRVMDSVMLEPTAGSTHFADLPSGIEYGLAALDPTTGGHAREFFMHDGVPHRLVLIPGSRVRANLVTPTGGPFFAPVNIVVERRSVNGTSVPGAEIGWRHELRDFAVGPRGELELVMPKALPFNKIATFPMPPEFDIVIAPPFRESVTLPVSLTPGATIDLGTITIGASSRCVSIAPGHDLSATHLSGCTITIGAPGVSFEGFVARAQDAEDGTLTIELLDRCQKVAKSAAGRSGVNGIPTGTWRDLLPTAQTIAMHLGDADGLRFVWCERRADGLWHRLETDESRVAIRNERVIGGAHPMVYGIECRGLDLQLWQQADAGDGTATLSFEAPRSDVRVWWFEDDLARPDHQGAFAVTSGESTLTIR